MTALLNATKYSVGKRTFPAFKIDEKYMKNLLRKDFKNIKIEAIRFKAKHMEGNMAITAKKS